MKSPLYIPCLLILLFTSLLLVGTPLLAEDIDSPNDKQPQQADSHGSQDDCYQIKKELQNKQYLLESRDRQLNNFLKEINRCNDQSNNFSNQNPVDSTVEVLGQDTSKELENAKNKLKMCTKQLSEKTSELNEKKSLIESLEKKDGQHNANIKKITSELEANLQTILLLKNATNTFATFWQFLILGECKSANSIYRQTMPQLTQENKLFIKREIEKRCDSPNAPRLLDIPEGKVKIWRVTQNCKVLDQKKHEDNYRIPTVAPFRISLSATTAGEYNRFCEQTATGMCHSKNNVADSEIVTGVTCEQAIFYTQWLSQKTGVNYRLPEYKEWEYAIRGKPSVERAKFEWVTVPCLLKNEKACLRVGGSDSVNWPVGTPKPFNRYHSDNQTGFRVAHDD